MSSDRAAFVAFCPSLPVVSTSFITPALPLVVGGEVDDETNADSSPTALLDFATVDDIDSGKFDVSCNSFKVAPSLVIDDAILCAKMLAPVPLVLVLLPLLELRPEPIEPRGAYADSPCPCCWCCW